MLGLGMHLLEGIELGLGRNQSARALIRCFVRTKGRGRIALYIGYWDSHTLYTYPSKKARSAKKLSQCIYNSTKQSDTLRANGKSDFTKTIVFLLSLFIVLLARSLSL